MPAHSPDPLAPLINSGKIQDEGLAFRLIAAAPTSASRKPVAAGVFFPLIHHCFD